MVILNNCVRKRGRWFWIIFWLYRMITNNLKGGWKNTQKMQPKSISFADVEALERVYANLLFCNDLFCFFLRLVMSKYWSWQRAQNLMSFLYIFCIYAYITENFGLRCALFLGFFKPMLKYKHMKENIYTPVLKKKKKVKKRWNRAKRICYL